MQECLQSEKQARLKLHRTPNTNHDVQLHVLICRLPSGNQKDTKHLDIQHYLQG